ncbi:hypothetical protein IAU59_005615 [Kwoniella sp. CBS 9459]
MTFEIRVGCFATDILRGRTGLAYDWWTTTCMDICSTDSSLYAYSWIDDPQDEADHIRQCLCTDEQPTSKWLESDSACPYPFVVVDYLDPPGGWEWYYCFDFLGQGPANPFPVSSVPGCLTACSAFPNAYFLYEDRQDHYTCACYQRGPPFTDYECGVGKAMHYYHTPPGSPPTNSAAVKRRLREKAALVDVEGEGKRGFELCPAGLRACKVPEEDQISYECLDTSSELESCGGCLYGEVTTFGEIDDHLAHSTGTDCTTLPGVLKNGVACHGGMCIAFACTEGNVLVEDTCVSAGFD